MSMECTNLIFYQNIRKIDYNNLLYKAYIMIFIEKIAIVSQKRNID